jgi:hypothetical protein
MSSAGRADARGEFTQGHRKCQRVNNDKAMKKERNTDRTYQVHDEMELCLT